MDSIWVSGTQDPRSIRGEATMQSLKEIKNQFIIDFFFASVGYFNLNCQIIMAFN